MLSWMFSVEPTNEQAVHIGRNFNASARDPYFCDKKPIFKVRKIKRRCKLIIVLAHNYPTYFKLDNFISANK